MDINVHVTIDETPAMLTAMDALCEAIKSLWLSAPTIKAEEIPDEVKEAAQVVQPAKEEPAKEGPAKEGPVLNDPQITAEDVQEIRAAVAAAVKKDKGMKNTVKSWLADNKLEGISAMTQSQLPAFKALIGAK